MSQKSSVRLDVLSAKTWIIDAICNNCNKQFNSMRAITIHLKMTGASHTVTFVNHGNYNKNTGFLGSSHMYNYT